MDYDPSTGDFTWKLKIADKVNIGAIAGSINKSTGYRMIRIDKVRYRAHRLAFIYMNGCCPEQVDHINHVRNDNRWVNLRATDYAGNGKNHPKTARNTTGVVGVSQRPDGKYVARIYVNKRHKFLGVFDTVEAAASKRQEANDLFGFHKNHGH